MATVLVAAAVILSALSLSVAVLAGYTTLALLVVLMIVNAALIGLKRQAGTLPFVVPVWGPVTGFFASLLMAIQNVKDIL